MKRSLYIMVFIVGIVGFFNVGKLIFFNVIIKVGVEVVNYLFVMIDLNVGIVEVFDYRLNKLMEFVKLKKIVLIIFEFIDIVGIVKGVSKGEGFGNKFLFYIC